MFFSSGEDRGARGRERRRRPATVVWKQEERVRGQWREGFM